MKTVRMLLGVAALVFSGFTQENSPASASANHAKAKLQAELSSLGEAGLKAQKPRQCEVRFCRNFLLISSRAFRGNWIERVTFRHWFGSSDSADCIRSSNIEEKEIASN
jgi:hypothetical protein